MKKIIDILINLIPSKALRQAQRKKFNKIYGQKYIIKEQNKVAKYLKHKYIDKYLKQEIPTIKVAHKKDMGTDKIIWQFWAQGINENTPEIVKLCFDSVKKYANGYKVIVLTLDTIDEYIDLPEIFYNNLKNKRYKMAFFSDMLRLYLLSTYGGVWIDATILLTAPISDDLLNKKIFMYQRTDVPEDFQDWIDVNASYFSWDSNFCVNVLNSFIIAQKDNIIINALKDILTHYWYNEKKYKHYFLFQILFNELIKIEPFRYANCDKINDLYPHLMNKHIFDVYSDELWNSIISKSNIHKLTYYKSVPQYSMMEHIFSQYCNV